MFLNFDLLELDELGAAGLDVQPAARLVYPTVLTGAHQQRHEGRAADLKHSTQLRTGHQRQGKTAMSDSAMEPGGCSGFGVS